MGSQIDSIPGSETASNRFSRIWTWTLKKSHRKIVFHREEKWFLKKHLAKNRENRKFSRKKSIFFFEIFFKIIFLYDEKIFFDGIFLKFNSKSVRIVWKRFPSVCNNINHPNFAIPLKKHDFFRNMWKITHFTTYRDIPAELTRNNDLLEIHLSFCPPRFWDVRFYPLWFKAKKHCSHPCR